MTRSLFFMIAALLPLSAQNKQFDVQPATAWVDTGIDVQPGDTLRFTVGVSPATG